MCVCVCVSVCVGVGGWARGLLTGEPVLPVTPGSPGTPGVPWKRLSMKYDAFGLGMPSTSVPGVLAQFEFAQQVTLGTSNIIPPQCPSPSTLTNHICVSDIGGPKALLF